MMKQRWGLDRNVLRPTPGDPWGVEQHHWNTGAEENQQLMPRLICVFAGRTATLLVLSWGGSKFDCTITVTSDFLAFTSSLHPHLPNGLSHHHLDESTFNFRGIRSIFSCFFIEIAVSKQCRPRWASAFCLPMSQKWDARLIWVTPNQSWKLSGAEAVTETRTYLLYLLQDVQQKYSICKSNHMLTTKVYDLGAFYAI